jgi:predicted 3-demethylubiquinone-9 3-methyltransferase (glyoxalase superfamily)
VFFSEVTQSLSFFLNTMESYPANFNLSTIKTVYTNIPDKDRPKVNAVRKEIYDGVYEAATAGDTCYMVFIPGLSFAATVLIVRELMDRFPNSVLYNNGGGEECGWVPIKLHQKIPIHSRYMISFIEK